MDLQRFRARRKLRPDDKLSLSHRLFRWNRRARDFLKELRQLHCIEFSVGPHAIAHAQTIRPDFANRFADIFWPQASGEKNWRVADFADMPADFSVVHASGSSQFFDG
jgi:hypothetical protein